jgi:hypothetical protein
MDRQTSEAVRQMLTDVIAAHTEKMTGEFNLMKQDLSYIKIQTTKTNGQVIRNTDDIQKLKLLNKDHFLTCPNSDRIESLENIEVGRKGVWRFLVTVGSLAVGSFAIVLTIIEIMKLIKKA